MKNSKYGKFLTVLLVIVIIGIVGLLGFLGYDVYKKYFVDKEARDFLEEFDNEVASGDGNSNPSEDANITNPLDGIEESPNANGTKTFNYQGFPVSGKIEIPKTNVKYPIISKLSPAAIEKAVAIQYGPGPNQVGNTVIVGHNYRNGSFFSNNKKLENGDIIYITDNAGVRLKYVIYNKYETTPQDTDYMKRDTKGAKEISLSTCTDDSKMRIIIWARAEE